MGIAVWRFFNLNAGPQWLEAEAFFGAERADAKQCQSVISKDNTLVAAPCGIAGPKCPPEEQHISEHERQDRPRAQRQKAQSADEKEYADAADEPAHMPSVKRAIRREGQV